MTIATYVISGLAIATSAYAFVLTRRNRRWLHDYHERSKQRD